MKVQTLSLVCGTNACNAHCPYCISKQTVGAKDVIPTREICQRKLLTTMRLAERLKVTTALITGKGEPTLAPKMLSEYIKACTASGLPLIELQTNGLFFADTTPAFGQLAQWSEQGLTLLAMSVMGVTPESNKHISGPGKDYPVDLEAAVDTAHAADLMFRLTLTMAKGYVDTLEKLLVIVEWAADNHVDQITAGSVTMARGSEETAGGAWAKDHMIDPREIERIDARLRGQYRMILGLPTGAGVYDVHGVAVCVRDCLSWSPDPDKMRQMIFYPEGRLTYDWESPAARLL